MAEVTASEVKSIIDTDIPDADVDAYILAAHNTVVSKLAGKGVSEALKKEIERWLAAHFIAATRTQQLQKAGAGPASATFQGKTDMGLEATLYGQQVIAMDPTGSFKALGSKNAKIHVIGGGN